MRQLSTFVCILLAFSSFSRAAVTIQLQEVGNDVVATISGSINSFSGASLVQTGAGVLSTNGLRGGSSSNLFLTYFAFTDNGLSGTDNYNNYTVTTSPSSMFFGNGTSAGTTFQAATSVSVSTDMFLRNSTPSNFWISQSYVLGTPITGTMTWANKTLNSLGVANGTYVWSWSADSVTLNIVPEPSALSLLVVGLGGVMALRRCRRSAV